eukprot:g2349.t1
MQSMGRAAGAAAKRRGFSIVVAATEAGGIGREGGLPWRLPGDMKFFKDVTSASAPGTQNAVVMGRKTWLSIPRKFRPLAGRINVVLSRDAAFREETAAAGQDGVLAAGGFDEALDMLDAKAADVGLDKIFVIGGGTIYAQALQSDKFPCESVFLTRVYSDIECDVSFPAIEKDPAFRVASMSPPKVEKGITYQFLEYKKVDAAAATRQEEGATAAAGAGATASAASAAADMSESKMDSAGAVDAAAAAAAGAAVVPSNALPPTPGEHEEIQYLRLVREVLDHGASRDDRTGTGTLSVFGRTMRFSLRDGCLPLLTTKRTFWRGVAEELLWFVSGATNAKLLQDRNIHIWDGNGSREYLDSIGLPDREEMDLGPVYGFQWRHFGAAYTDMHDDYAGKGVDQLAQVIEKIKTKPCDRRIILSAWNPAAFEGPKKMALPPCHMFAQFYVANGELSCQMYQRSADMGLGVPFNIASYALLTHMIAHVTGLKTGEFVHVIGDCHVYKDHVDPLKEQLLREPRPFPTLKIKRDVADIDGFTYEDFEVEGYKPHKSIKMKMSV